MTTGPYTLPVQSAEELSTECVVQKNESVAWQCAYGTAWQLRVLRYNIESGPISISVGSLPRVDETVYRGHQAPEIAETELTKSWNGNTSSGNSGVMYSFRALYDHIVLLKENDLTPAETPSFQPAMQNRQFQLGEALWRCVFEKARIQGSIYAGQKALNTTSANTPSATVKDPPRIPYKLNLIEEHLPSQIAYCETYKMNETGIIPVSGKKVWLTQTVPLVGVPPKIEPARSVKFRAKRLFQQRKICGCQWTIQ